MCYSTACLYSSAVLLAVIVIAGSEGKRVDYRRLHFQFRVCYSISSLPTHTHPHAGYSESGCARQMSASPNGARRSPSIVSILNHPDQDPQPPYSDQDYFSSSATTEDDSVFQFQRNPSPSPVSSTAAAPPSNAHKRPRTAATPPPGSMEPPTSRIRRSSSTAPPRAPPPPPPPPRATRLEPSIFNVEPIDEFTREVADWLWGFTQHLDWDKVEVRTRPRVRGELN